MKPSLFIATLAVPFFSVHQTMAGTAVADFNDLVEGQLSNFTAGAGQAGGSGFDPDPSNTWGNTGTIITIAGDLAAPASTNYSFTQGVTPISAQGTFTAGRQATRALAAPLVGSTVWFSFLLNQPTENSRGGITFNQNGSSPGDPRIVATGGDLRLGLATIQPPGGGANGVITIGETALVLGRLTIDTLGGEETLDVWINPDVSNGEAGLPAPTNTLTQEAPTFDAGISRLGVQTYSSDGLGGIVDALIVSDEPNAFEIVAPSGGDPDDPNLVVSGSNPFAGEVVPPETPPITVDVNVSNTGVSQVLTISDTSSITGSNAVDFSIVTALPINLNPGEDTDIQIRFEAPGDAGDYSATLNLDSNDETTATTTVPLFVSVPPILQYSDANPFAGLVFGADPPPVTAPVTLTNSSTTSTVTIAGTTAVTGDANFTLVTAVPFDILPGASADVQVQFDAAGAGGNFTGTLQIDSNDPGNESFTIPLATTVPIFGTNLLANGDFEADPAIVVDWNSVGSGAAVVAGIAPSSTNAAFVQTGGNISQSFLGADEWFAEFYFSAPDTTERAFNVRIAGVGGQINLRYQGTSDGAENSWNAFTESDGWGVDLGLDDVQPDATYLMRIIGRGFGTGAPTYDLQLSGPNSTAIVSTLEGLDRFQLGTPTSAPTSLLFTTEFGNSLGFTVDDVRFVNGPPPPVEPVRIISYTWDPDALIFSFDYLAQVGVTYSIQSSNDLINWLEEEDPQAMNPIETFTETDVTEPRRFYRVIELD